MAPSRHTRASDTGLHTIEPRTQVDAHKYKDTGNACSPTSVSGSGDTVPLYDIGPRFRKCFHVSDATNRFQKVFKHRMSGLRCTTHGKREHSEGKSSPVTCVYLAGLLSPDVLSRHQMNASTASRREKSCKVEGNPSATIDEAQGLMTNLVNEIDGLEHVQPAPQ